MISVKNTKNKIYFIDYENVHRFDPAKKQGEEIKVVLFVGVQQKYITIDTIIKLDKLKAQLEFVQMNCQGKNCLDFHLVFKMGEMHNTTPALVEFIILSKDKDYDNIVNHIKSLGRPCKRKTNF